MRKILSKTSEISVGHSTNLVVDVRDEKNAEFGLLLATMHLTDVS